MLAIDAMIYVDRKKLLNIILWFVSLTALLPELDIPVFSVDLFNLAAPLSGVILLGYNFKKIKDHLIRYKKEIIIICLFFLTLLASSLLSVDRNIAIKEYTKYLEVIILFSGILIHIRREEIPVVYRFFLQFIILLAAVGIIVYIFPETSKKIFYMHKEGFAMLPRNESLMHNPNNYGAFSAILVAILFFSFDELKKRKILTVLIIASIAFGLIASGSFNGLFVLSVVFISYFAVLRNRILLPLILGIIMIASIIFTFNIKPISQYEKRPVFTEFRLQLNSVYRSWYLRKIMWNSAISSIADNTILGTGPSVFNEYHYKYSSMPKRFKREYHNRLHTHNIFLQILVEAGVLGFAFFSSIFVLLYQLIKKQKYYAAFPLAAFLAGNLLDFFLWDYFMRTFFVSLLAIAIFANRNDELEEEGAAPRAT